MNPTRCYIDKRIQKIISRCRKLGRALKESKAEDWNELIEQTVNVFKEAMPESEEEIITTDEEMQLEEFKEDLIDEN